MTSAPVRLDPTVADRGTGRVRLGAYTLAFAGAIAALALSAVGDEDRVRQVVLNLLTNAIKFTNRDGRVAVVCGTTDQPHAALRPGRVWTYVRVEDTGCGIRARHLEMIFEPSVQALVAPGEYHVGGTGLGLAISRQLARLMGGDVSVKSELGAGSTFTLWLPAR